MLLLLSLHLGLPQHRPRALELHVRGVELTLATLLPAKGLERCTTQLFKIQQRYRKDLRLSMSKCLGVLSSSLLGYQIESGRETPSRHGLLDVSFFDSESLSFFL